MIQAASSTYECQPVLQKKTYPNRIKTVRTVGRFEFFVTKNFLQILPELAYVVQNLLKRVIFASPIRLQFTPCIYITLVWLSHNKQRMFLPCRIITGDGNLFAGGGGAHFNGLNMCVRKWFAFISTGHFKLRAGKMFPFTS